jgi:hypothetical protein
MSTTSAERMRKTRQRRRSGLRAVTVIVSEQDIDYLMAAGYQLSRETPRTIGKAVEAFLSDSAVLTPLGQTA